MSRAWRKGRRYGTVLVDLERNRVVDLLPDRQAQTLATWLRAHPGIEVVARDRAGAFADGAAQGAPEAVQVADRWHLLRNVGDALRHAVERHHAALRRIGGEVAAELATERATDAPTLRPKPVPTALERRRTEARARRQALYDEAVRLRLRAARRSSPLPWHSARRHARSHTGLRPVMHRCATAGRRAASSNCSGATLSSAMPRAAATRASSGANCVSKTSKVGPVSCGSGSDAGTRQRQAASLLAGHRARAGNCPQFTPSRAF